MAESEFLRIMIGGGNEIKSDSAAYKGNKKGAEIGENVLKQCGAYSQPGQISELAAK